MAGEYMRDPLGPRRSPAYEYWLRLDTWKLGEAVLLLMNLDPNAYFQEWRGRFGLPDEEENKASDLERILRRALPDYSDKNAEASVDAVLSVAQRKGLDLPEALRARAHAALEAKEAEADIGDVLRVERLLDSLRPNQKARLICRVIAVKLWEQDPSRSIASIIKDPDFVKYGDTKAYPGGHTARDWIEDLWPGRKIAKEAKADQG